MTVFSNKLRSGFFFPALLLVFAVTAPPVHADPFADPDRTGYDRFTIPWIDLAECPEMQVLVDREEGQYLGHVTTVLLDDGKTILCVYPKGHGSGAIVYKKSRDGGKTWSERLPTPKSWETSMEVPTLFRTVDASGKKRVVMFSGAQSKFTKKGPAPIRMAVSEDEGESWSELKPIGDYTGVVAMADLVPLNTGKGHYMALYHLGEGGKFVVRKVLSTDGGLTWSKPVPICAGTGAGLCEPGAIRSPDGKQIAVLLRENKRQYNSQIIFSDDEGKTWTEPRPLPASLTGDRHTLRYTKDGRIFASFRDFPPKKMYSPTSGDWVGWIGTYQDLLDGTEGRYRVRLMKNTKGFDTTYPGVVVLPDDTIVATTYGHWEQGKPPYIMTVRFKPSDLERLPKKVETSVPGDVRRQVLFRRKVDGYNNIRIPAICTTKKGTLLAFAEGRVGGDAGKIELILRRSTNHGRTWEPARVVWKDGENTCGNPAPVVDFETGTVWLFTTWNYGPDLETRIMDGSSRFPRIPYLLRSDDDGITWSKAEAMPHLRRDDWRWYATGPCNAIQLTRGAHKGRLVVPANHSVIPDKAEASDRPSLYRSHIIFSDDHGKTWRLGGLQEPLTNESTVVELSDGSLMQNMRSYHGQGCRAVAVSRDGGRSFPESGLASGKPGDAAYLDPALETPVCQANILRYDWPKDGKSGTILFSSPKGAKRSHLTVWMSLDDGKTWPCQKQIFGDSAAYSNLVALPDGRVGLLAEVGEKGPYETISFLTFSIDRLRSP